jgi:hypothetical protein
MRWSLQVIAHPCDPRHPCFTPGRWSLSPAYDLNPVPEVDRVHMGKTAITEDQEEPTIDLVLSAADRFGLKP